MEELKDLESAVGGDKREVIDHPIIREDLCTKCNICVDFCTDKAIVLKGNSYFILANLCTRCGSCIDRCPTDAIRGIGY